MEDKPFGRSEETGWHICNKCNSVFSMAHAKFVRKKDGEKVWRCIWCLKPIPKKRVEKYLSWDGRKEFEDRTAEKDKLENRHPEYYRYR